MTKKFSNTFFSISRRKSCEMSCYNKGLRCTIIWSVHGMFIQLLPDTTNKKNE